jgi:hypothetical protein
VGEDFLVDCLNTHHLQLTVLGTIGVDYLIDFATFAEIFVSLWLLLFVYLVRSLARPI